VLPLYLVTFQIERPQAPATGQANARRHVVPATKKEKKDASRQRLASKYGGKKK
jgi:hypothetical protein